MSICFNFYKDKAKMPDKTIQTNEYFPVSRIKKDRPGIALKSYQSISPNIQVYL